MAYHVNCMGGAIYCRVSNSKKRSCVAVYFELESTNRLAFVHNDDRIVILTAKELAGVGRNGVGSYCYRCRASTRSTTVGYDDLNCC